ncbi:MAG: hypothetical protein AVDCRST_MAG59-597, partial [uncultured Thermomicrobiales bacterium]
GLARRHPAVRRRVARGRALRRVGRSLRRLPPDQPRDPPPRADPRRVARNRVLDRRRRVRRIGRPPAVGSAAGAVPGPRRARLPPAVRRAADDRVQPVARRHPRDVPHRTVRLEAGPSDRHGRRRAGAVGVVVRRSIGDGVRSAGGVPTRRATDRGSGRGRGCSLAGTRGRSEPPRNRSLRHRVVAAAGGGSGRGDRARGRTRRPSAARGVGDADPEPVDRGAVARGGRRYRTNGL